MLTSLICIFVLQRDIMCEPVTYEAAKDVVEFVKRPAIKLKGIPKVIERKKKQITQHATRIHLRPIDVYSHTL